MTRGVVVRLIHMFGTKWGQIDVAGQNRECFFNRASLLSPEDFPGLEVTQTRLEMVQTAEGEPAAQVALSGPQFTLSHNLVMFETPEAALSILAGIKEGQIAQGIILEKMDNFRDVSGILSEVRGSQEMLTLFFVEGRALVRISLSGPERHVLLPIYAEKARAKASRQ